MLSYQIRNNNARTPRYASLAVNKDIAIFDIFLYEIVRRCKENRDVVVGSISYHYPHVFYFCLHFKFVSTNRKNCINSILMNFLRILAIFQIGNGQPSNHFLLFWAKSGRKDPIHLTIFIETLQIDLRYLHFYICYLLYIKKIYTMFLTLLYCGIILWRFLGFRT